MINRNLLAVIAFTLTSVSMLAQKESITIHTKIYCDHFKQCESGGTRLYQQLMDVEGIRNVKINDQDTTVLVTYNSDKIDEKGIRDAVNAAGFDADDQKAPEEARAKLDGCCRKS